MADIEKVKKRISDIAARRTNVTTDEIQWVAERLGELGYGVRRRKARHGELYTISGQTFMVNSHNPGNKQVKAYSVDEFIDAMTELELYEE